MIKLDKIQNSRLLTDLFGRFPSFHDAEVHRINLLRGEISGSGLTLSALIYVYQMVWANEGKPDFVLKNHVLTELRFAGVWNLKMAGFNHQNVLNSIEITELDEAESGAGFEVLFESIFGVSAKFCCEAISIESVTPYPPQEKPA